jgi:phosphoglycerol transferase MdoB-like AlkP superfamily enzyme
VTSTAVSPPPDSRIGPAILGRLRPAAALLAAYLLIGFVLRLVLWWKFGRPADAGVATLPVLLGAGIVNDGVQGFSLLAPFVAYFLLARARPAGGRRPWLAVFAVLLFFSVVYVSFSEYYFFEEFNARFNIVAFDYLMYPTEVVGDLWAEYPVLTVLGVAAVTAVLLVCLLRHALFATLPPLPLGRRLLAVGAYALAAAALVSLYPTDALSRSRNRVKNEIAQNGLGSFFRAAYTSEIDYATYYATRPAAQNLQLLEAFLAQGGSRFTAPGSGSLEREFPARADGLGRLNVVLVSSEAFGAEFSQLYGSERNLTPHFDALARAGMWFSRTYASGTRTVRGLEALTSSFPPIPTVSILRRPGNENIATWGAVMRQLGYHTSFLYGGYGYFDNMNYFYANNGFEVLDREAIDKVRFENIWGVSDEDLFDRSIAHFDALHARGTPFFSIIMTTSNHKPFTFRKGLEVIDIPPQGGGRPAGVKYADYALGYFLREAAGHEWFDNTVFVVIADHGARVYGKTEIPLRTYEIPLLVYAPKHIRPQRIDTLMTQVDVAPTVLGLLGLPYRAPFFGQDVRVADADRRVAVFNHNHDVAILKDDRIVIFGMNRQVGAYRYDRAANSYTRIAPQPELEDLGIAWFQTASELFRDRRFKPAAAPPGSAP